MIFAKVEVSVPQHHRFLRIPREHRAAAIGVWTTALCYSRREELDGFCPEEAFDLIATEEILGQLVRVGLFSRKEQDGVHGVIVLKYAEHNETKADIELRKVADRCRKGKGRAPSTQPNSDRNPIGIQTESDRNPNGIRSDSEKLPVTDSTGIPVSDSDSDSDSEISEGEHEREPDKPSRTQVTNITADGAFGQAVTAWADGIREVTGKPFALPRGGSAELSKLVGAMAAHCPEVALRVDWARSQGQVFARQNRGKLSAHSFVDWLNSPPPPEIQRGPPPVGTPAVVETAEQHRERQRRADDEFRQLKRAAAPAPVGALFAAIGGKRS
jgi:hypothetical protein